MIITIAHQKGGTGKSTIATNLAVAMQAELLDLDKQHSSIIFNYNRKDTEKPLLTCYSVLESRCRFAEQTPVAQEELESFMNRYSGNPDNLLIVDCGGFDSQNLRGSLFYGDCIVTPLAPSGTEIYGLQMFGEMLAETSELTKKELKTHVLINNADLRSSKRIQELRQFVQSRPQRFILLDTIVGSRQAFKTAYEEGLAVTELEEQATSKRERRRYYPSSQELQALIYELQALIGRKGA